MTNKEFRRNLMRSACKAAGVDLNKDFFSLSSAERANVEEVRKAFKFKGKNNVGRTPGQQFYYYVQD